MPGHRNMQIGGVLLIAGLVLIMLVWRGQISVGAAVAAAVMLTGGVLAVVGVLQWRTGRGRVPGGLSAHRSDVDVELLVRSMVMVAAADRSLDRGEVAMIEDVLAGLLGETLPRARIERVFRQIQGKNRIDQIARLAKGATPEGADLALKGAVWAGRADGALTEAESRVIAAIAEALGVSGHHLRTCIAEADHVYDRLAAHGGKGAEP